MFINRNWLVIVCAMRYSCQLRQRPLGQTGSVRKGVGRVGGQLMEGSGAFRQDIDQTVRSPVDGRQAHSIGQLGLADSGSGLVGW